MDTLENQECPFCHKKAVTIQEDQKDIPFFGKTYLFSMNCSECKFFKADVESAETKDPVKCTFMIENEKDMKVRVVKGSEATVKISQLKMEVTPGPASNGYITNIEGVLNRFEKIIKDEKEDAEDDSVKKHAKVLLKKLWKIKLGELPLKVVIEDPSGNSAIISEKTIVERLKVSGKKMK